MRQGHERKTELTKELNLENWRQARFMAFMALKPHLKNQNLSIVDFLPLPGDEVTDVAQLEKEALAAIEQYTRMGLLKPNAQA